MPDSFPHESFKPWADDFQFSRDIRELEEARRPRPKKTPERKRPEPAKPQWQPFPGEPVRTPDEAAEILLPFDELDVELFQDNRTMARQIEQLLTENRQLQFELECRDAELSRFRHVFGRLYRKR